VGGRLSREEGRKVRYRKRKKPHRDVGTAVGAMCPIAQNALWALDFLFDTTVDGRTLNLERPRRDDKKVWTEIVLE
jgi:putative transposase